MFFYLIIRGFFMEDIIIQLIYLVNAIGELRVESLNFIVTMACLFIVFELAGK